MAMRRRTTRKIEKLRRKQDAALEALRNAKMHWLQGPFAQQSKTTGRAAPEVTASGEPLSPLYTAADTAAEPYTRALGFPGEPPYTRGIQPTMYRGRLWSMRQYAGFASAAETNARFRYLLEKGQTGLSVAFDLPTQMGFDSDHPRAAGEVGRAGVAVDTVDDMARLFEGIPLDRVSTSMTINAPAAVLLAMYQVVGERQEIAPEKLRGTVQSDIIKEYSARHTYIFPPAPSIGLVAETVAHCVEVLKQFNPISVSGYHLREAGCTATQEVGFTLAAALAYIEACRARGLALEAFAGRFSFFFSSMVDLLEEVAKFRAARRLWYRLITERYKPSDPACARLRFHVQTAGSTLLRQEPLNNVVRVTVSALAAVLGGCQSLHTNGYDEALGLPSAEAATLALRTQQIVALEAGVAGTADPLGGSFALEAQTDRIEAEARAIVEEIDAMGGAVAAVESGYIQKQIAESAWRYAQEVEQGTRKIVGLNAYAEAAGEAEEQTPAVARPPRAEAPSADTETQAGSHRAEAQQKESLGRVRAARDTALTEKALAELKEAAADGNTVGIFPVLLVAVRATATVGEICDCLRAGYGTYRAPV